MEWMKYETKNKTGWKVFHSLALLQLTMRYEAMRCNGNAGSVQYCTVVSKPLSCRTYLETVCWSIAVPLFQVFPRLSSALTAFVSLHSNRSTPTLQSVYWFCGSRAAVCLSQTRDPMRSAYSTVHYCAVLYVLLNPAITSARVVSSYQHPLQSPVCLVVM